MIMFKFQPRITQEGKLWAAYDDVLEIGDCGSTKEQAIENLKLSIRAYCYALDKRGLLEQRLQEKGIKYEVISPKSRSKRELETVLV